MSAQPDPREIAAKALAERLAAAARGRAARRPGQRPGLDTAGPARRGVVLAVDAWGTPTERCELPAGHQGPCPPPVPSCPAHRDGDGR